MPEIIVPESDNEFPMPTSAELGTVLPLDKDGNVVITDVQFPMPKVMTQHYAGPDTEPDVDEKTVDPATVDTKVVKTSATK